jgi:hypothetical protein
VLKLDSNQGPTVNRGIDHFTGWLAVRLRIRLDQYEMLLTESLEDAVEEGDEQSAEGRSIAVMTAPTVERRRRRPQLARLA